MSPWFLLLLGVAVAGGVLAGTWPTESESAVQLIAGVVLLVLGGWCVSLCLHEFAHAAVAYRGGDTSVREKGYLTLDIRRYTDLGLSFILPVLFLLLGGIPLPGGAVWINHAALRSRAVRSAVSLAGPAMNLLLGVGLALAVSSFPAMPDGLVVGLSFLAFVQVLAFVLNILPIPGLDGFGVIEPYLPPNAQRLAAKVRPWAPLALFVLIFGVPGVSGLIFGLGGTVFRVVGGDEMAAFAGYRLLLFWR